jgi:hypothetical protein
MYVGPIKEKLTDTGRCLDQEYGRIQSAHVGEHSLRE